MNPDAERLKAMMPVSWVDRMNQLKAHKEWVRAERMASMVREAALLVFGNMSPVHITFDIVDDDQITINLPWCGVDVGWPVEVASIAKKTKVPGYRIWQGKVTGGTHWPEEVEDVTYAEGIPDSLVLRDIMFLLLASKMDDFDMSKYYAPEPEPEEQVDG